MPSKVSSSGLLKKICSGVGLWWIPGANRGELASVVALRESKFLQGLDGRGVKNQSAGFRVLLAWCIPAAGCPPRSTSIQASIHCQGTTTRAGTVGGVIVSRWVAGTDGNSQCPWGFQHRARPAKPSASLAKQFSAVQSAKATGQEQEEGESRLSLVRVSGMVNQFSSAARRSRPPISTDTLFRNLSGDHQHISMYV